VVANSGGADILMQSYYYLAARKTCHGLGLLPYKFIPHWQANSSFPDVDFDQAFSELQNFGAELPIIKLHEGEFKVIYKQ
jgi:peptidase E